MATGLPGEGIGTVTLSEAPVDSRLGGLILGGALEEVLAADGRVPIFSGPFLGPEGERYYGVQAEPPYATAVAAANAAARIAARWGTDVRLEVGRLGLGTDGAIHFDTFDPVTVPSPTDSVSPS